MFFKKKRKDTLPETLIGQKINAAIQYLWNLARNKFVVFFSNKTANLPASRLKNYLMIFCIICFMISLLILIYPFITPHTTPVITVQPVRFPVHTYHSISKLPTRQDSFITFCKYQQIILFEKHLDSMKYSEREKEKYDSLMIVYPGLRDSIQLLKQLYQNQ